MNQIEKYLNLICQRIRLNQNLISLILVLLIKDLKRVGSINKMDQCLILPGLPWRLNLLGETVSKIHQAAELLLPY
jgi:hypothetical protein